LRAAVFNSFNCYYYYCYFLQSYVF